MLKWVFGGSSPDPIPVQVARFVNPKVNYHEEYITVCFQPYLDSGGKVQFATNPEFGEGRKNPFAKIAKSLNSSREEFVVFTEINAEHVHNEFNVNFVYRIGNLFDFNPSQGSDKSVSGTEERRIRVKWAGVEDPQNDVETKNEFTVTVPALKDEKVSEDWKCLYDCTLSEELISKFAGQYDALMNIPPQQEDAQICIFPAKHPLVLFINACKEPLEATHEEFKERPSERNPEDKVYHVSNRLIADAEEMLKTTIYSKMFSTTMKDTAIKIEISKEDDITLAKEWGEKCKVSNTYRPSVSFILHVKYYKVDPKKPKSPIHLDLTRFL
jgi:hypothetical protein